MTSPGPSAMKKDPTQCDRNCLGKTSRYVQRSKTCSVLRKLFAYLNSSYFDHLGQLFPELRNFAHSRKKIENIFAKKIGKNRCFKHKLFIVYAKNDWFSRKAQICSPEIGKNAENRRKSPKIVIISFSPGHTASHLRETK
jgi:hypothetical protein